MKKQRRRWYYFFAIALFVLFAAVCIVGFAGCGGCSGCNGNDDGGATTESAVTVTSVTLDKNSLSLEPSGTGSLTATVKTSDDSSYSGSYTWTSSDTSVATVSGTTATGSVKAVAAGAAAITVTAGGVSASAVVTVAASEEGPVEEVTVSSVTLDKYSLSLAPSGTGSFVATVTMSDSNAEYDGAYTWVSSDESVATVSGTTATGSVTAVAEGSAAIMVTAGGVSACAAVTVTSATSGDIPSEGTPSTEPAVSSVTLDKNSLSLEPSGTGSLTATVTMSGDGSYSGSYTWTSSDETVATVSGTTATGSVTAVGEGSAAIMVTAGGVSACAAVTVAATETPAAASVLAVTLSHSSLDLIEGTTGSLSASVLMSDGETSSEQSISWAVDTNENDSGVVSLSPTTGSNVTVTASSAGNATVTATVGEKSATCTVTVSAAAVSDISMSPASSSMAVGETKTLTATVSMNNGTTSSSQSLTWASSDESVATVAGSGNSATLTAVGAGGATITASVGNSKVASCAVKVAERLTVPDTENDDFDKSALALGEECFEGSDYVIEKTTTEEDNTEKTVYKISGTASGMSNAVVSWYNGGSTGAAKAGDSYITLKIFVGEGNTISYSSYGDTDYEDKSFTNDDSGKGSFDGDYFYVVDRLTGVHTDGTQVTVLDGETYKITNASGETIEEVNIEYDMRTAPWDGKSISTAWDVSTKVSEEEEYTLYSAEELAGLAYLVNDDYEDASGNHEHHESSDTWVNLTRYWTVKLGADIDLGDQEWEPIGGEFLYKDSNGNNENSQFRGYFDGQNHTVFNLKVSRENHAVVDGYDGTGLFGFVGGGEVKNLTVENANVSGRELVGGIIGVTYEFNSADTDNIVNIDNCHVTGHVEISGNHQVGGILGYGSKVEFTDCSVEGDSTSFIKSTYAVNDYEDDDSHTEDYDGDAVGGIAGYITRSNNNFAPSGTDTRDQDSIEKCQTDANELTGCAVSNISISGCRKVGGLVGHTSGSVNYANCSVEGCTIALVYNSAYSDKIDSGSPRLFVGALVGEFEWVQTVTADCTVSNVAVIYIAEDGITGNYTPVDSEANPYAGLFGGSRNQAGYDSNNNSAPYSQVVYAELTDNPGTNATVNVDGLILAKLKY